MPSVKSNFPHSSRLDFSHFSRLKRGSAVATAHRCATGKHNNVIEGNAQQAHNAGGHAQGAAGMVEDNAQARFVSPITRGLEYQSKPDYPAPGMSKAQTFLSVVTLLNRMHPDWAQVQHVRVHDNHTNAFFAGPSESSADLMGKAVDNGSLVTDNLNHTRANQPMALTTQHPEAQEAMQKNMPQLGEGHIYASPVTPTFVTIALAGQRFIRGVDTMAANISLVASSSPTPIAAAVAAVVASLPLSISQLKQQIATQIPHIFVEYVKEKNGLSAAINDTQSALKSYLENPSAQHVKVFAHDASLMDTIARWLGLTRAMLDTHTTANALVRSLVADIDFSTKLPGDHHKVTHNGQIFLGLGNQEQKIKIIHAKDHALAFLSKKIQDHFDIPARQSGQAQVLAQLVLKDRAPELAHLKASDPAVEKMHYGQREWATYRAGFLVAEQQGLAHNQTIAAYQHLGEAILLNNPLYVKRKTTPDSQEDLPLNNMMLIEMAQAQGVLTLHADGRYSDAALRRFDEWVEKKVFKNEIAIAQAIIDLAKPMPTRRPLVEATLAQKLADTDIDPNHEVPIFKTVRGTGLNHKVRIGEKSLVELYMDDHVLTHDEHSAFSRIKSKYDLPAVDHAAFKPIFNAAKAKHESALRTLSKSFLRTALNAGPGEDSAPFLKLESVKMICSFDYESEDAFIEGRPVTRTASQEIRSHQALFMQAEKNGRSTYFFLLANEFEKGLQPLPAHMTPSVWAQNHIDKIFTGEDLQAARKKLQAVGEDRVIRTTFSKDTEIVRHAYDSSHTIPNAIAHYFTQHYIAAEYDAAYAASDREKAHEIGKLAIGFILPFATAKEDFAQLHSADRTERLTAVTSVLGEFAALGFAAMQAFKWTASAGKIFYTGAKAGITNTIKHNVHTGMRAALHAASKRVPQLTHRSAKLGAAVVQEFLPLPDLPKSVAKLHTLKPADMSHLAGTLARHTDSSTQALGHKIKALAVLPIARQDDTWHLTDTAAIQKQGHIYTTTLKGHRYPIALLDGQATFFKSQPSTDSAHAILTPVNPSTHKTAGLPIAFHLSSHNVLYPNAQTTAVQLADYPSPITVRDITVNHQLVRETGAQRSYRNPLWQDLIQIGNGGNDSPYYHVVRDALTDSTGEFKIVHHSDSNKKIPVTVIDGKWQIKLNTLPETFQNLQVGDTPISWKHPLTQEELTVVRLVDDKRVVALKHEDTDYIEVNVATGLRTPSRKVFKIEDNIYTHEGGTIGGAPGGRRKIAATKEATRADRSETTNPLIKEVNTQLDGLNHQLRQLNNREEQIAALGDSADRELNVVLELLCEQITGYVTFTNGYRRILDRLIDAGKSPSFGPNELATLSVMYAKIGNYYSMGLSSLYHNLSRVEQVMPDTAGINALIPSEGAKLLDRVLKNARSVTKFYDEQADFYARIVDAASFLQASDKASLIGDLQKTSRFTTSGIEDARQANTKSMTMRHFEVSNIYADFLGQASGMHLRARMLGSGFIEQLTNADLGIDLIKQTEQLNLLEQFFLDAVIKPGHRFDIDRSVRDRYEEILSVEDQYKVLDSLGEQYQDLGLQYQYLATQFGKREFTQETALLEELIALIAGRQKAAEKALEKYLKEMSSMPSLPV